MKAEINETGQQTDIKTKVKLIECPRDAMQGWDHFIPTQTKVSYINSLMKVGFDTLDCGSFVSARAIPQMADTREVLSRIDRSLSTTKLLAIVANQRGAEEAVMFDELDYLGFPFSVSETFQRRNTNAGINESFLRVEDIQNLCIKNRKQLVVYLSMGFGNPYGDEYSQEIVLHWAEKIAEMDVQIISLADTVGLATPEQVRDLTALLVPLLPGVEIGVHLHAARAGWEPKVAAALNSGCLRFDGALKGIGGCPMAGDALVGNMDTELMIPYFQELNLLDNLDHDALAASTGLASEIFI